MGDPVGVLSVRFRARSSRISTTPISGPPFPRRLWKETWSSAPPRISPWGLGWGSGEWRTTIFSKLVEPSLVPGETRVPSCSPTSRRIGHPPPFGFWSWGPVWTAGSLPGRRALRVVSPDFGEALLVVPMGIEVFRRKVQPVPALHAGRGASPGSGCLDPGTDDQIPHVVSDQLQVGFEGYPAEGWFVSAEGYYRAFDGVVTTNLADNPNDDGDDFLPGTGVSWGTDFFLRHTGELTSGWLAVSFLRARRTFPDFLSGLQGAPDLTYPPVFDRRVDVDLILQRDLGGGFQGGLRWNFGSGLPYTRPLGSYRYLSQPIMPGSGLQWDSGGGDDEAGPQEGYGVVLSQRNGARYPARHRLDVSVRWTVERSWGRLVPYLSVLNVYNRKNVLFYFYQYDQIPPVRTGISMFPFLPTLGLEVSF